MKLLHRSSRWLGLTLKVVVVAAVVVALFGALGGQGDNGASAATTTVQVGQRADLNPANEFNANAANITEGDTVSWVWFDGVHNVTPFDPAETWGTTLTYFDGTPPDQWDVVFSTAGTQWYLCTLHASVNDIDTNGDGVVDGSDSPDFGKMIGRIDIQPAVTDTTGPTTSSVAASPNPTDGASSTTLTASVDDTATGNSNIAAAEYFIDVVGADGSGTAMSPSDGSFDSPTEAVTASVNVSALADGTYTLFVHGQDSAGNWGATSSVVLTKSPPPAGAESATISILGGTLSVATNPVDFGTVGLTGVDQTVDTAPSAWFATDARGTGSGWNVTTSSTDFTSAGGTITVDNFRTRLLDSNIVTVSGNAPPASQVTTYQPLSGVPLKLLSATAGNGMGTYDFTPDFRLIVPAESAPGDYESFMTVSINSGP